MTVTRERKLAVFAKFQSRVCPGCGQPKNRMHWLCEPCQARVSQSELNGYLTAACAARVVAAENLIELAKGTCP